MVEDRQAGPVRIPASEWQSKYKSKREQFEFLTVQCKAYLSSYETVTIYFCKDLITGKKSYVKCDSVKVMFVP